MRRESIHERAVGRWRAILPQVGVAQEYLDGKHHPCPACGGKDRFRFTDREGRGGFFCNGCGAGNGVDLVMKVHGIPFIDAVKRIEAVLPQAVVEIKKSRPTIDPDRWVSVWKAGRSLDGDEPASWYLARRGIALAQYPGALRYLPEAGYRHDDKSVTRHPAMVALFTSPDMSAHTVHFTYLDEAGHKAGVPKVRKLAPAPIPAGGAVRLFPAAEHMGIAEGIETALAAHVLNDLPVWAALSAGAMMKWEPPPTCKHVTIFADTDTSYTGQSVAFNLAQRLTAHGFVVNVEAPGNICRPTDNEDWNDALLSD